MRAPPPDARAVISSGFAAANFASVGLSAVARLVNVTTSLLGAAQGGFYFLGLLVLLGIGASAFVRLVFIRPDA